MRIFPARTQLIHNSGFPLGWNDGPVWAGRGFTGVVSGGVGLTTGALTIRLIPTAFTSQNGDFALRPNGLAGDSRFADWRNPGTIDLPQRFGSSIYTRVDPGESEIRVDAGPFGVGVATGNEYWGPAMEHPVILGNNAGGFPRLFLGTSEPTRIWKLGRVHGRLIYGGLSESAYSPMRDSGYTRLASGATALIQPAFLPGLELGASRFFHVLQRGYSLDAAELTRPFGAFFKVNQALDKPTNQLVSVFTRLVLPHEGMEIYGEFGREDYNWDLKEFWQFLDHDSAYLLGLAKAWQSAAGINRVRAEILNSRVTHLALSSPQEPMYVHSGVRQGHTHRGQALGSVAGHGGGASVLAFDRYNRSGRLSASWERLQLGDVRNAGSSPGSAVQLFQSDIAHVWRVNQLRFGARVNTEIGAAAVYELNRRPGIDAWSAQTTISFSPGTRLR
jgi:hypothetical protein